MGQATPTLGKYDARRMCCLSCGYTLNHLCRSICPECGRPFDPQEPRTYHRPHESWDARWRISQPAFFLFMAIVLGPFVLFILVGLLNLFAILLMAIG